MTHNCAAEINEKLKDSGWRLAEFITSGPARELFSIQLSKRNEAQRGLKKTVLFASYCPFCGVELKQ